MASSNSLTVPEGASRARTNTTMKKQNSQLGSWAKSIAAHSVKEDGEGEEQGDTFNTCLSYMEWFPIINFL